MSFLLPSCEEIPPEALPASDTISSPKSDMCAGEPFISKGTIEHSSNCEFLLKIYHFLSCWKSLSSTKLTYTQTLSAQIFAKANGWPLAYECCYLLAKRQLPKHNFWQKRCSFSPFNPSRLDGSHFIWV